MAIKHVDLADLQGTIPLVDAQGLPSPAFLRFLNTTVRALKNGVNNLIDVQNAVDAANAAAATANAARQRPLRQQRQWAGRCAGQQLDRSIVGTDRDDHDDHDCQPHPLLC
jgi:hypothetical protein